MIVTAILVCCLENIALLLLLLLCPNVALRRMLVLALLQIVLKGLMIQLYNR